MFFDSIEKHKDNIALIIDENNKISYKDILDFSSKFQKKIKPNSLSILISENCVESLCGYISLLRSNNPVIVLDPYITKNDLQILVNKFQPQYIFCSKKNQKKIRKNLFNLIHSFRNFNLFQIRKNHSYKINEKLMLLLSTSGSLSEPKFVKLSLENMVANTKSIVSYLNLNSKDRSITTMPMSYSYGLSIINSHLISGASIILNNFSLVDKNFWKLYNHNKPSNLNGVPFFYDILKKIGVERILENKPRFITQAGGKIKNKIFNEIAHKCLQNDISFYLMYGQTEASPRISYHKVKKNDVESKMIPIGKPIDGGVILLKDENGSLISKTNIEGELIYKGKNIFGGYAKNYNDLNLFDSISELRTGDLAIKDKNEIFFITGRKSRFIKVYGYRINLDYIEEKINSKHRSIACVAVDEKIYIFSKNKNLNLKDIANIPKKTYKILTLKEFPINNNGKISYGKLVELLKIKGLINDTQRVI